MTRYLPIVFSIIFFVPFLVHAQETSTLNAVEIIIEADTLTPTFYNGRPEPTVGSTIHAIATVNGKSVASSQNFSYRWEVDGTVLEGEAIKGLSKPAFTAADSGNMLVEVQVYDTNNVLLGQSQRYIHISSPEVLFYEINPLRGLSRVHIGHTKGLIGEELSIRAEPYFMSADIFQNEHRSAWSVDNKEIHNFKEDPREITLQNTGGTGTASIQFSIRNGLAFTQFSERVFELIY